MNLTWTKNTGQFASGSTGCRNGVAIFFTHWDATRPKSECNGDKYSLGCNLPAIKKHLGHFKDDEAAQVFAEKAFEFFCKKLDLTINQPKQ